MSDSGWNTTPPGDSPRGPSPQWGDPRGYGDSSRYGYPTAPPPLPPTWTPEPPASSDPGPKRSRRRLALAAGVVAIVVVAAGTGAAVGSQFGGDDSSSSKAAAASASAAAPTTIGAASQAVTGASGVPKSYAAIAAAVLPVVVSIDVVSGSSGDTGSGIVIESNGYILTNNHVVAAAATSGSVTVHFNDGTSDPAKIIGTDLSSDLAVIKVTRTGLQVAHIGSSAGVRVGDAVLAVGSPLGLSGTVTSGIVSALNRPVDTTADQEQEQQQQQQGQGNQFDPFGDNSGASPSTGTGSGTGSTASTAQQVTVFGAIQTDAAINPGNSGGALVDANGNVIGINSAIASLGSTSASTQSGSIGVGFAIPIDLAKNIAQQLIKTGKATHAQLGISVDTNTDQTTGVTKVVVAKVPAGTPGATAGLAVGDVIQKIDSTIATDSDTLIATIRSHLPGDKITLVITRGGVTKTLMATLGTSTD